LRRIASSTFRRVQPLPIAAHIDAAPATCASRHVVT
jgi:hypothetical protein